MVGLIATSPLKSTGTGVPNPGGGSMACWELATQQEMSSRQASEALSVITAAPHTSEVTVSHYSQVEQSSCRKTSSGFPLILHYGEVYNYFIIYHNEIIIEIKCIINVMCLNYPETIPPSPWSMKKKLSSMKPVPGAKTMGMAAIGGTSRGKPLESLCGIRQKTHSISFDPTLFFLRNCPRKGSHVWLTYDKFLHMNAVCIIIYKSENLQPI